MKKVLLFLFCSAVYTQAFATDLMQIFQQALISDPKYQQAISQRLSDQQNVPISVSALLPNVIINGQPQTQAAGYSGPAVGGSSAVGRHGYDVNLTVTQTIFDYGQFSKVRGARSFSKQADAVFNAAIQDLIIRVGRAYFAILLDKDNIRYIQSTKTAYAKQLYQVTEEYKVGLKTVTDVFTAQASYDSAVANEIGAETTLKDDQENLRAITGVFYTNFAKLSEGFPLIKPCPNNIDAWSTTAQRQNWTIRSAQYAVDVARATIQQQFAGHLPSVNIQGIYDSNYYAYSGSSLISLPGGGKINTKTLNLNLVVPVFQGAYVVSKTRQAQYDYNVSFQKLEQSSRGAVNLARQSFLGVISGISQVQADQLTIKSTQSSYEGLAAGYRVGTQTLVDVLNQQQKILQAEKQYAIDRYSYVNNLLALKQAAGTLCPADLLAINSWLN